MAFALALGIATSALAADASWDQYQGDAAHDGTLSAGPEPPYRVRWTLPAPMGGSLSGPVIAGDVAVTLGQEAVYGIDLATGTVSWRARRDGGPLSVPAVTTGSKPLVLFIDGGASSSAPASPSASASASPTPSASASPSPSGSDEHTSLVAISLNGRREAWRVPLPAPSRTGVTLDGDTAFVADQGGNVTAVAARDGTVRWTADAGGRIDVPLAVGDGLVVAVARNVDERQLTVNAFGESDGRPAWAPRPLRLASTAASAPAIADGAAVVGLPDRLVHAISLEDGSDRWQSLALSVFSPATAPAVADGSLYIADLGGGLYAFDAGEGGRRWSFQLNEIVLRSAPVRSGGYVLLGLQDGRLIAIDDATGHLAWTSGASPGLVGTIALAPDAVVAVKGGRDAGLIAWEHDPSGRLVDVPSPTQLDVGRTLGRVAAAAAIALAIVLVPGVLARRRFGDAFDVDDEDEGEGEA
jgi:outer membrane protein assembly factor BamB